MQLEVLKKRSQASACGTYHFLESLHLPDETHKQLMENYFFIRKFEQIFQICMESSSTKVSIDHPVLPRLGKVLKISDPFHELQQVMKRQNSLLKLLDANA